MLRGVDVEPKLDATSDSGSEDEDGVQALWIEEFLNKSCWSQYIVRRFMSEYTYR